MSKGAQKTGGSRRRSRSARPRQRPDRDPKRPILIVAEGERTEKNYFYGLNRRDEVLAHFSVKVKVIVGKPVDIVNEALRHAKQADDDDVPYERVWCVLDVEEPDRRKLIDDAAAMAEKNGLDFCLSNPCFEVWLLSHFERKASAFTKCDQVIDQLNKHWTKNWNQRYQKNDGHLYDRIADLTKAAIKNARWVREKHHGRKKKTVDCNSSTDVYKLVEYLITPPKTDS